MASSLPADTNKQAIYRRRYEAKFGPGNYAEIKKIQMRCRRSKTDCEEKEDALRDLLKEFRKNKKARRDNSSLPADTNKPATYRRKYEAKFGPGNYNKIKKIQMRFKRGKTDCEEKKDALRDLLKEFKKNNKTSTELKEQLELLEKNTQPLKTKKVETPNVITE